jgi:hypothetical protein
MRPASAQTETERQDDMPSSNHTCYPGSNSRLDAVTEGVVYQAAESPDTQQLHRLTDSEDDAECISQDGCNCQIQIQNVRKDLLGLSDIADDTTREGK